MDYSAPGSSVHGILQARTLECVSIPSSRGIFLTQGSNLGLLHCRQILYCLSHQGSQFLARVALFMKMIEAYKGMQAYKADKASTCQGSDYFKSSNSSLVVENHVARAKYKRGEGE